MESSRFPARPRGALTVVLAGRSALADQGRANPGWLVELKGGNERPEHVILYADPHYHALRGGIRRGARAHPAARTRRSDCTRSSRR